MYKKVDHRRGVRLAASDEISSFVHGPTHPAAYARPKLIPNLLLANKQVYEEAVPILYGASFVFGDMKSLFQFLVNIGPNKKRFVQRLVIVHIGGDDMLAHTAFTHLRGLESLKELTIDGYMWSNVREIATRLYQLGVHWMEAVAAREGRHDAAVDIIALSYESLNLRGPQKTAQQKATQTSIVQERLRKLLRRR